MSALRLNLLFTALFLCLVFVAQKLAAFHFLGPLTHAAFFHLAAMGLGAGVLHFMLPAWRSKTEQWIWGWALGFGFFGVVQFFAAHLQLFGPQIAILLYLLGVGAWVIVIHQNRSALQNLSQICAQALKDPWIVLSCCVSAVVVLGTFTPPLFWDSNVYHLARPMQYILWGGAEISPHHTFSANPLLAELALSPVLILSFDPVHMNVAHSMGIFLLLGAAVLFAKRFISSSHAGITAASLLALPVLVFAASAMKSDLYTAIFVCGVVFILTTLYQEEELHSPLGWMCLLGFFAGCGGGTRYHGALFLCVILAGSLLFSPVRHFVFQRKNLLVLLLTGLFAGSLFFVQNALLFSNPTYPFLDGFWGTGEITQRFTETYTREKYFTGLSLDHLLRLPFILIYDVIDGDMNDVLGFMPLLALVLALSAFRKNPKALRFVFLLFCCTLPFWLMSSPRARYLPLMWLLIAFACSAGFAALERKTHQWVASGLFLLTLGVGLSWNLQADEKLLGNRANYIFGHQDRETYLREAYGPFGAYDFINKNLPSDAVIFIMGDNRAAYLERRAYLSGVYVTPHHEKLLSESEDASALRQNLKATGSSHLLISRSGMKRLEDWGWGQWTPKEKERLSQFFQQLGEPIIVVKDWALFEL